MQRLFSNDQAITPDRELRVVFDPDETVCLVPAWGLCREAAEVARASQVGSGSSVNVSIVGDTWQLTTVQHDPSAINEETAFQDLIVPATDFNYAVPFGTVGCPVSAYNNFRVPTDIPGVTALPGVQTTGDTFTRKDVTAGYSTNTYELTTDLAQFPKPPPCTTSNVPVDRLAVGRVTYPENCGFHLRFIVPGTQLHAPDVIGAFYFGGSSGAAFNPSLGFALVLYGNGDAELWELAIFDQAKQWGVRCRFSFSPPAQVAGRVHGITIQPHGTNTISFRIASATRAVSQGRSASAAPSYASTPPSPHAARFTANALVSGYVPGKVITGPGNIRLDVRRDLLLAWQVSILDYLGTGRLVDHEFIVPFPTPIGTVVTLAVNAIIPEGCSIIPLLFAANDTGMTTSSPAAYVGGNIWQFSLGFNSRGYFLAFDFTGNSAKRSSPQMRRFSISFPPVFGLRAGLNAVAPVDQTDEVGVSISGFDGDPTHETASIHILNQDGSLLLPRQRGRLQTRVDLGYVEGSEVKVCYLFDGQSVDIERSPFGKPLDDPANGISPLASIYDGQFVGKWAKGHERFMFWLVPVGDFNLNFDLETGKGPAVTVTSVIRDVFRNVIGVSDDMLDIPELAIPFQSLEIAKDAMIQPKQNPFEYVLHLVRDYLGWTLFWDRNAIPRGRWRIKPQVELFGPQSDPIWNFVFGPSGDMGGKDPIAPESYPDGTIWIEAYSDEIVPPEYNYIEVWATNTADYLPSEGGPSLCMQNAWNPDSFQFDPAGPAPNPDPAVNPDFVGEMLPLVVYDPTPGTPSKDDGGVQGYVDALTFYLIQQYGRARKRFRFRAPYVLALDPTDPYLLGRRPLRHNDPITIGGLPAILENVNLDDCDVEFSMAWYQGVFSIVPTSG